MKKITSIFFVVAFATSMAFAQNAPKADKKDDKKAPAKKEAKKDDKKAPAKKEEAKPKNN
jgi:Ni/Co efflux regulator RcnB